jgi:hypothetical protein
MCGRRLTTPGNIRVQEPGVVLLEKTRSQPELVTRRKNHAANAKRMALKLRRLGKLPPLVNPRDIRGGPSNLLILGSDHVRKSVHDRGHGGLGRLSGAYFTGMAAPTPEIFASFKAMSEVN